MQRRIYGLAGSVHAPIVWCLVSTACCPGDWLPGHTQIGQSTPHPTALQSSRSRWRERCPYGFAPPQQPTHLQCLVSWRVRERCMTCPTGCLHRRSKACLGSLVPIQPSPCGSGCTLTSGVPCLHAHHCLSMSADDTDTDDTWPFTAKLQSSAV